MGAVINQIFIKHPHFFPTVLKCSNIGGDNSLFLKIVSAKAPIAPVLNTPMLQVVVGTLEVNLHWNTILMDFLGSQHRLSGPVEKLSQSIGQPELDIGVDTLTDFVRFHQVALPK